VNEVLTIGRQQIASVAEEKLQELCNQFETGITVDQVVLQDVNPPDFVKPSFNDVNEAQQEREKLINQARAEYNQIIPKARGEAEETIQNAEGYALDRVNRAKGEAARFTSLFAEYKKSPEVTRRRIYLETMGDILPRAGRKIVIDEEAKGFIPLLDLRGKGGTP
jgi:membrane protease subunit HflK